MEEFMDGCGLSSFTAALATAGVTSPADLGNVSDEVLMGSLGMRKMHVNKLRRAAEKVVPPSAGAPMATAAVVAPATTDAPLLAAVTQHLSTATISPPPSSVQTSSLGDDAQAVLAHAGLAAQAAHFLEAALAANGGGSGSGEVYGVGALAALEDAALLRSGVLKKVHVNKFRRSLGDLNGLSLPGARPAVVSALNTAPAQATAAALPGLPPTPGMAAAVPAVAVTMAVAALPATAVAAALPCAGFQIDMAATEYGRCLCGRTKAEHGGDGGGGALVVRAVQPCASFSPGAGGGSCRCGWRREEHPSEILATQTMAAAAAAEEADAAAEQERRRAEAAAAAAAADRAHAAAAEQEAAAAAAAAAVQRKAEMVARAAARREAEAAAARQAEAEAAVAREQRERMAAAQRAAEAEAAARHDAERARWRAEAEAADKAAAAAEAAEAARPAAPPPGAWPSPPAAPIAPMAYAASSPSPAAAAAGFSPQLAVATATASAPAAAMSPYASPHTPAAPMPAASSPYVYHQPPQPPFASATTTTTTMAGANPYAAAVAALSPETADPHPSHLTPLPPPPPPPPPGENGRQYTPPPPPEIDARGNSKPRPSLLRTSSGSNGADTAGSAMAGKKGDAELDKVICPDCTFHNALSETACGVCGADLFADGNGESGGGGSGGQGGPNALERPAAPGGGGGGGGGGPAAPPLGPAAVSAAPAVLDPASVEAALGAWSNVGADGVPLLKAALTAQSAAAVSATRSYGAPLPEVEVVAPPSVIPECHVRLLVAIAGIERSFDVMLPPTTEPGMIITIPLPAAVREAIEKGKAPASSAKEGGGGAPVMTDISLRSVRKKAAKLTGLHGTISGKGKEPDEPADLSLRSVRKKAAKLTGASGFISGKGKEKPEYGYREYDSPYGGGGFEGHQRRHSASESRGGWGAQRRLSEEFGDTSSNSLAMAPHVPEVGEYVTVDGGGGFARDAVGVVRSVHAASGTCDVFVLSTSEVRTVALDELNGQKKAKAAAKAGGQGGTGPGGAPPFARERASSVGRPSEGGRYGRRSDRSGLGDGAFGSVGRPASAAASLDSPYGSPGGGGGSVGFGFSPKDPGLVGDVEAFLVSAGLSAGLAPVLVGKFRAESVDDLCDAKRVTDEDLGAPPVSMKKLSVIRFRKAALRRPPTGLGGARSAPAAETERRVEDMTEEEMVALAMRESLARPATTGGGASGDAARGGAAAAATSDREAVKAEAERQEEAERQRRISAWQAEKEEDARRHKQRDEERKAREFQEGQARLAAMQAEAAAQAQAQFMAQQQQKYQQDQQQQQQQQWQQHPYNQMPPPPQLQQQLQQQQLQLQQVGSLPMASVSSLASQAYSTAPYRGVPAAIPQPPPPPPPPAPPLGPAAPSVHSVPHPGLGPYQEIAELEAEAIAAKALEAFGSLGVGREACFALLRTAAALCEELDATGRDPLCANRVFNTGYYFAWNLVRLGAGTEELLREYGRRVRECCIESLTLDDAKFLVDDHVGEWQANRHASGLNGGAGGYPAAGGHEYFPMNRHESI